MNTKELTIQIYLSKLRLGGSPNIEQCFSEAETVIKRITEIQYKSFQQAKGESMTVLGEATKHSIAFEFVDTAKQVTIEKK